MYLIIACLFLRRRKKLDEQVLAVQHNVKHNNIQNESNKSMYNNRNEIVMDNGTTTTNNDDKQCDDIRNEGETTIVSVLDDTDIGQV